MKMLGKSSLSSKLKVVLDVTWYLGIVVAVLVTVAVPVGLWGLGQLPEEAGAQSKMTIGDIGFRVKDQLVEVQHVGGGAAYVTEGVGTIAVEGAMNMTIMVTAIGGVAVLMAIGLFIIWQLRKLFRRFAEGNPFDRSNVGRLRAIGTGMLGLSIGAAVFTSILTYVVSQQFHSDRIEFVTSMDFDASSLFSAAVVFILAEIFRLGAEMQEEQALTV